MIKKRLCCHPHDPKLRTAQAQIYYNKYQYARAAQILQWVLNDYPNYEPATALLESINEISPNKLFGLNTIGVTTLNEYVADLNELWDYSIFYYNRDTEWGPLSLRINYAKRLGKHAPQGEIEFVPVLTPYFSIDLLINFSQVPELFPRHAYAIEPYITIPKTGVTLSAGEFYAYIKGPASYRKYTASISKEFPHDWLNFRVNHYIPNIGKRSTLYIGKIRHYFTTYDSFVTLTVGDGKSPDLADLLTLNFIVIDNRFANVDFSIPIGNHRSIFNLGFDYQNWRYPSGLIRRLYGITVGLNYRF